MVELGDKTGTFGVTCFSGTPAFDFFKGAKEGSIVSISGHSDFYQGRFSPRIGDARMVEDAELSNESISLLVECSPENPESLMRELQSYIDGIKHEGLRLTTQQVIDELGEVFYNCPAAVSMHHAYRHGLLEHTVHVTRAGRSILAHYPEVNGDLATAGMIMHDVGKTVEYEGYRTTRRSKTGILQGHVVLGYRIVRKAAMQNKLDEELCERLEHIILSHQGELEWGAAVMASTPEAVFVSMVDNLDAKMGMVQQAIRKTAETDSFSEYYPGLKANILTEQV